MAGYLYLFYVNEQPLLIAIAHPHGAQQQTRRMQRSEAAE